MRTVIAITGASGSRYGVDFVKRCPGEKFLILSRWGRMVLREETGLQPEDLAPQVQKIYANDDLAAPFASGTNPFDTYVIAPCSVATLGKIANGISDSLIPRVAEVALKERRRMILVLRESPLSTIALENALKLSRDGVMIMPAAPGFYQKPGTLEEMTTQFVDKILDLAGCPSSAGWRARELK